LISSDNLIQVLLPVKNGEKYLEEQLDSLASQVNVRIELIVGIAKSCDATSSILENYPYKFEKFQLIQTDTGSVTGDYLCLVREARSDLPTAFCDQDDVWYPTKLHESLMELQKISGPGIVTVGWCRVNPAGKLSRRYFFPEKAIQPQSLLFQNRVLGCSTLMNSSAIQEYKESLQDENFHILAHDWWILIIVSLLGEVRGIHKSLFGYRIHSSNSVGIPKVFSIKWFKNRLKLNWASELMIQLTEVEKIVGNRADSKESLRLRHAIEFLNAEPKGTLSVLFSRNRYRKNLIDEFILRLVGVFRMFIHLVGDAKSNVK
jgi:glycosyltransferase involved in cell wall biosynthesis